MPHRGGVSVPRGTVRCRANAICARRRCASTTAASAISSPQVKPLPCSHGTPLWRGANEPVTRLGNPITGALEWQTSAYAFNKQGVKPIPSVTTSVEKMLLNYITMKQVDNTGKDFRQIRTALAARRKSERKLFISKPHVKDYGDRVEIKAFVFDGKQAAKEEFEERQKRFGRSKLTSGSQEKNDSTLVLSEDQRAGLRSLLARIYGKDVDLKLLKINKAHLDADILSQYVAQRLRDRRFTPRRVIRDATWRAPLPSAQAVAKINNAKLHATPQKFTWQDLTFGNASYTNATSIVERLRLSQVSSIQIEAAGRLTKRLTANRSAKKMARRGTASKGPAYMLRGFRKAHTAYSFASGKRRVGQFGIKVSVGHT